MSEHQPDSPRPLCLPLGLGQRSDHEPAPPGQGKNTAEAIGAVAPGLAPHAAGEEESSPMRVSTPHELKSCPSTSPTHPGIHATQEVVMLVLLQKRVANHGWGAK